jgi:4,5-DOPA dioxygenase extradiol
MAYAGVMTDRQPTLFLSHGAPPLADDRVWTSQLRSWGANLGKPTGVLMVSAHWENAPIAVSSTTPGTPLVYDFYGFPQHYYKVTYDAPPAPELADAVAGLLGGLHQDAKRGLDHGAYVPLKEMFPDADVPVVQLSLPTLAPAALVELGRKLAPLRDEGTLIVGSGFTTHNLSWFGGLSADSDAKPPRQSAEFDAWARQTVAAGDLDALIDFQRVAPAAREAHPRTEHWAPLYVALGAAEASGMASTSVVDGFWYGLSKRSWQFD